MRHFFRAGDDHTIYTCMNALTPDDGPVRAEVLLVGALGQYFVRQVVYRIRTVDVVFHVTYRPADHVERIRRPTSLCLYCAHDITNAAFISTHFIFRDLCNVFNAHLHPLGLAVFRHGLQQECILRRYDERPRTAITGNRAVD